MIRRGDPARTEGGLDRAFAAFSRVAAAVEGAADIDDLLHVIARQVSDLVGVERCSIHLRDEPAGLFRGCVGHAGDQNVDADVKRSLAGMPADGMTLELLRTRRPVIIANARTDPRLIKSTVRFWDIRSIMAVPMIVADEVIGVIYLDDTTGARAFSPADAEVASAFGNLAAVAVSHAQECQELRAKIEAGRRQIEVLRRATAVDERLSDLVLADRSLQELLEALADLLGKSCAVYDGRHERLAVACPAGAGEGLRPRLLEAPCVGAPEVQEALDSSGASRAFVVGPLPGAGVHHRYLVAPIRIGDELLGRLVVMEQRRFTGGDMLTLRRAATLIALQMSTERKALEADWDAGASMAAELLGGCSEPAVVHRRAERLGVDLGAPHVVTLIGTRTADTSTIVDHRSVVAAFAQEAPGLAVQATAVDGGVAALVGVPGEDDDGAVLRSARCALERVCARLGPQGIVAGLSGVRTDAVGYAEAYVEAQQVVECIKRFAPSSGHAIFSAAELGAGRVFLATSDRDVVRRFADATFGVLVRDPTKADLLATLRSFFDNMASIRRCALRLGVHENTIRYRLARVEKLTGLLVTHDPDAQLRARLSLLVLMLQGRLPAPILVREEAHAAGPAMERDIAEPVAH